MKKRYFVLLILALAVILTSFMQPPKIVSNNEPEFFANLCHGYNNNLSVGLNSTAPMDYEIVIRGQNTTTAPDWVKTIYRHNITGREFVELGPIGNTNVTVVVKATDKDRHSGSIDLPNNPVPDGECLRDCIAREGNPMV